MIKRKSKKSNAPEHSSICVAINNYSAAVDASINYEVKDERRRDSDTKVYNFDTRLEIEGRCTYPEDSVDEIYYFTIYSSSRREAEFTKKLKDCHVIDDIWQPVYRTVKGMQQPVYDIPKGLIGLLERRRGTGHWTGWLWLPPQTVTDMMVLLSHVRPIYLSIQRLRHEKNYYMAGFTVQTNDPAES